MIADGASARELSGNRLLAVDNLRRQLSNEPDVLTHLVNLERSGGMDLSDVVQFLHPKWEAHIEMLKDFKPKRTCFRLLVHLFDAACLGEGEFFKQARICKSFWRDALKEFRSVHLRTFLIVSVNMSPSDTSRILSKRMRRRRVFNSKIWSQDLNSLVRWGWSQL